MKYIKYFENYINDKLDTSFNIIYNLNDYLPFPPGLHKLFVKNCELIELPKLPSELVKLNVNNNKLIILPELPKTLIILKCSDNNLTELPNLPDSLIYLDCSDNNLTELPELPKTLQIFNCSNNNLTELPELPKSLVIFNCSNNNWEYPISGDILGKYNLSFFEVYSDDLRNKFCSYEYQKDFLTKYPEKYKELIVFGFNKKIKEEFDWLFNAVDMGLM